MMIWIGRCTHGSLVEYTTLRCLKALCWLHFCQDKIYLCISHLFHFAVTLKQSPEAHLCYITISLSLGGCNKRFLSNLSSFFFTSAVQTICIGTCWSTNAFDRTVARCARRPSSDCTRCASICRKSTISVRKLQTYWTEVWERQRWEGAGLKRIAFARIRLLIPGSCMRPIEKERWLLHSWLQHSWLLHSWLL